jgi:hypothetical protein
VRLVPPRLASEAALTVPAGPRRDHRRLSPTVCGHEPIVTAAPMLVVGKHGARAVPMITMLRCSCGWHGGQVSNLSPGNGGRARPALAAHRRHVARALAGLEGSGVPWWLTVEQAVTAAEAQ